MRVATFWLMMLSSARRMRIGRRWPKPVSIRPVERKSLLVTFPPLSAVAMMPCSCWKWTGLAGREILTVGGLLLEGTEQDAGRAGRPPLTPHLLHEFLARLIGQFLLDHGG